MPFENFSTPELAAICLEYLLSSMDLETLGIPWRPARSRGVFEVAPNITIWEGFQVCVLATIASIFRLMAPGMTLRQLLVHFIRCVPVHAAMKDRQAAALATLRTSRCTKLLDMDCETVATIFEEWEKQRQEGLKRDRTASAKELQEVNKRIRKTERRMALVRPEGTKPFLYMNKEHRFPFLQRLLLECLSKRKPVSWDHVVRLLWGNEAEGADLDNRLRNLQFKTNARLSRCSIPLRVSRPQPGYLRLEDLDSTNSIS
jgi:hypothetical protein